MLFLVEMMSTLRIQNFTVICLITWPMNGSEAGDDLVLLGPHDFQYHANKSIRKVEGLVSPLLYRLS